MKTIRMIALSALAATTFISVGVDSASAQYINPPPELRLTPEQTQALQSQERMGGMELQSERQRRIMNREKLQVQQRDQPSTLTPPSQQQQQAREQAMELLQLGVGIASEIAIGRSQSRGPRETTGWGGGGGRCRKVL